MIPQPKFIPGQEVFVIVQKQVYKDTISMIEWDDEKWTYDLDKLEDFVGETHKAYENFSQVMEALNG